MAVSHPQRRHVASIALTIVALLVGACQPAGTATPAATAPFIAVAPDRVPVGGSIAVIGTEWRAGEEVTLGLLPTAPGQTGAPALAVVTADAQGRFRLDTTIPLGLAPGTWQVSAQTRTPGRFAVATLTILEPTPLPPTATPEPPPTATATATAQPRPQQPLPTQPPRPTNTPLPPPPPTPPLPPIPAYPSWRGEYFDNVSLSGAARVVRIDTPLDFNWGNGAPDPSIPADNFSVRWTTLFGVAPGTYRFVFFVDDGVRLYIDNVLVLDEWQDGPPREVFRDVTMAGRTYTLRVEYYERTGFAALRFSVFGVPQFTPTPPPTPTPTRTPQPPAPTPTPLPPTPTFTPLPTIPTPIPLPTNTPIPTAVPLPTPTPAPPTPTFTPIPPTPTFTPAPLTPTFTPIPPTPTFTSVPPTPTFTPVPPTPTPTFTPIPPTPTFTPVPPTPTPTFTPIPPTPTFTPEPPTPTPTFTPIPPTPTFTPEPPTPTPTFTPEPPTPTPTPEAPTPTPEPTPTRTPAPPTPTPTPAEITATAVLTLADLKLTVTGSGWASRERLVLSLSRQPDGTPAQQLAVVRADTRGKFAITVTLESAPEPDEVLYVVVRSRDQANRKVIVPVQVISPP